MSSSETNTDFNLDDILAALESPLTSEEYLNYLPLTQALEKSSLFAKADGFGELYEFIRQELYGYKSQIPNYRYVCLSYFDTGGQIVDGLDKYSIYPIVTEVCKLEMHLKNGLTLVLPKQVLMFLSQTIGHEVATGHVSSPVIKNLLEAIRDEAIVRVKKTIKN